MLVTPNHLFSGVFFVDFSISDLADSLWQNQLRYILLVCENVWDIWKFLWDEILSSWCSRPLERDQQSLKWSSNKNTSQVPRPTCFSKDKWVGPKSDHWLCLSLIHALTHALTNWLLFSKLDSCNPGVWRCQHKTCWGCYCCWCW